MYNNFLLNLLIILKLIVALFGVFIIFIASVKSFWEFLYQYLIKKDISSNTVRLSLGYSILLGLEFIIGADIIESIVNADYYSIGLLAFLVAIRIILSYFLNKELKLISSTTKKEENL